MSLNSIDQLNIDNPSSSARVLQLLSGDLVSAGTNYTTDFLVVSIQPQDFTACPNSLVGALQGKGLNLAKLPIDVDYRPAMPCYVSQPLPSSAQLPFKRILVFEPQINGMSTADAAPYQVESIFRALQCFQAGKATSVTLPLVSAGSAAGSGGASASLILRMLFHAATQWGALKAFSLNTVNVVMHQKATTLVDEFADLKSNYLNLDNPNQFPKMPSISRSQAGSNAPPGATVPYSFYANQTLSWMGQTFPSPWAEPITQRQVFGIHMYTTSYFHAMNDTLRQTFKSGYTDLNNPHFIELQPLFVATSGGLMGLADSPGKTYRGIRSLWNPFKPGSDVPILSYMSTARPPGIIFQTSSIQVTTQGFDPKDISKYSEHPWEHEHLYDRGITENVVSNSSSGPHVVIATNEVNHKFCSGGA